MQCYFTRDDVPLEYLSPDMGFNHRIPVLVNERAHPNRLEAVLEKTEKSIQEEFANTFSSYSAPRLIKQYKFASLYELQKMKGSTARRSRRLNVSGKEK